MERLKGNLPESDLNQVVRTLYLQQASGVLEVAADDSVKRLFFLDGHLFLPPNSRLAGQLASDLSHSERRAALETLTARMATVIAGWREGRFTFDPGRSAVPPEAVGPLPTAVLVMTAAVAGASDDDLRRRLGGEGARLASRPNAGGRSREMILEPQELELLDRLGQPALLAELLPTAPAAARRVLEALCRLHAVGLVEVVKTRASAGLVDDQLLARFNQRVAAELEREPLELEVGEHRQRLAELLVDLGELDHYQLLGVSIAATTDDVYDAYRRLARMVHPSHADRLGLTGLEEAVSLLFERATEAYLVLSDPERRSRYNREMGLVQQAVAVDPAKDREQLALMARQHFLQAQHLVQDEEYHYAVELLRQAIRSDPRPEYYALLGEVQSKNPNWLRQAADSFRHAVRLAPGDMSLRLSLGQTFEELGDLQRALAVYRGIVVRQADHQEAQAAIDRLGGHRASRRGLLGQIFGRS